MSRQCIEMYSHDGYDSHEQRKPCPIEAPARRVIAEFKHGDDDPCYIMPDYLRISIKELEDALGHE